jgi:YVTN family beta-propeller protein
VPNTDSNTVTVIDPKTYKVVGTIPVGLQPQHVVPSWDLRTLWVNNDVGNTLTPIDPATGTAGRTVDVHDPYNLYFTPDGRYAVVMASLDRQLVFRDPHTMAVRKTVPVDCYGVNHADFSPDGRYFIVSCEFSGELLKVDTARMKVVGRQRLPFEGAMPQDVKVSPDGRTWYIADMMANGVWVLNGDTFSRPALRRQPRHGRGVRGRQGAVAVRAVRRGGVRDRHGRRPHPGEDPGRFRTARPGRLPAAGPLLARPHGRLPLSGRPVRPVLTC